MNKQQVSAASEVTDKDGLVEICGKMAAKVRRWAKKCGMTPRAFCHAVWREAMNAGELAAGRGRGYANNWPQ